MDECSKQNTRKLHRVNWVIKQIAIIFVQNSCFKRMLCIIDCEVTNLKCLQPSFLLLKKKFLVSFEVVVAKS